MLVLSGTVSHRLADQPIAQDTHQLVLSGTPSPFHSCFRARLARSARAFGHGEANESRFWFQDRLESRSTCFRARRDPSGIAQLGPRSAPHLPSLTNKRSSKIGPKSGTSFGFSTGCRLLLPKRLAFTRALPGRPQGQCRHSLSFDLRGDGRRASRGDGARGREDPPPRTGSNTADRVRARRALPPQSALGEPADPDVAAQQ